MSCAISVEFCLLYSNFLKEECKLLPQPVSSSSVIPLSHLSLVGTMSTELGFTGSFIPAAIEINGKVSSDFSIS